MKNYLTLILGCLLLLSSFLFTDSKISSGLNGIALGVFIVNIINLLSEDFPQKD